MTDFYEKIVVLCFVFLLPLVSCDAPFWYKVPDLGYVYICEDPQIEYVSYTTGDVSPNSTLVLDGKTIEFDLCFRHTAVDGWLYREEDNIRRDEDLLFFGSLRNVKDDGFTIKLEKVDDSKSIFNDYGYKELVFKKQEKTS